MSLNLNSGTLDTLIGASTPLTVSTTGVVSITNTTASSSTSTGALIISGGLGVAGTISAATANFTTLSGPHSGLTGLLNDDHTQYALLAGRSGGQILTAGTASGNNLTLRSTTNGTKGRIIIDETTASTSTTSGALTIGGGLGVTGQTWIGDNIYLNGDDKAFVVDALAERRLGIVKKSGAGPFFAIGNGVTSSFDFKVGNASTIDNVASTTYTSLMSISNTGVVNIPGLTGSQAVFTDGSDNLISVAVNGTGNVVLTTSPTLITPNIGVASGTSLNLSSTTDATNSTTASLKTAGGIASALAMWAGGNVNTNGFIFCQNTVFAPPTITTARSIGTKFVLYNDFLDGVRTDYSLGIETDSIWYGVPSTSQFHKFYHGTTNTMTLSGTTLSLSAALTVSGISTLGATNSVTISSAGAVTIPVLTASKPVSTNGSNVLITSPVTGTGSTVVLDTNPILVTPNIGVASGTSLNLSGALTVSGISTMGATTPVTVSALGVLRVDNETDATSSTAGAAIVDGGLAVAKKAFIGTDLLVSGRIGVGTTSPESALQVVGVRANIPTTKGVHIGEGGLPNDYAIDICAGTATSSSFIDFSRINQDFGGRIIYTHTNGLMSFHTNSSLSPSFSISSAGVNIPGLTVSQAVFTDGSDNLVSVAVNGTGNVVLTTSPTLITPNIGVASGTSLNLSGALTVSGISTLGATNSVTVSAAGAVTIPTTLAISSLTASKPVSTNGSNVLITSPVTGTGSTVVLDTSPVLITPDIGVASGTSLNLSGALTVSGISTLDVLIVDNETDATSSTAGAAIVDGGLAVAKKAFIGTDLLVSGRIGVGTTSPESALQVVGVRANIPTTKGVHIGEGGLLDDYAIDICAGTATSASFIDFSRINQDFGGRIIYTHTNGLMSFHTNNSLSSSFSISSTGVINIPNLSASQAVFTDGSDNLVSVAVNGSGNVVLTTSPVLITPNIGIASGTSLNLSGALTVSGISTLGATTPVSVSAAGVLRVDNETDATSSTAGAAIVDGGLAVAKKLYVGTSEFIGGGDILGISRLALHGVSGSAASGPHFHAIVDNDNRPAFQLLTFAHNNICLGFDVYFNGTSFIKSDNTSGYRIYKTNDQLEFLYSSGIQGDLAGENKAIVINSVGTVSIGNPLIGTPVTISADGIVTIPGLNGSQAVFTNSSGNLISVDVNGSGNVVLDTSPVLITPNIGVASGTSLNLSGALTVSGISTLGATTPVSVSAAGVLRVDNETDATSSTTGAAIVDGGLAVAKKAFIGTDLLVSGRIGVGTTSSESALQVVGARANTPTTKGVHIGEGGSVDDYAIDICAGTATSASFIDFTRINQDYRGRILYTHTNDLMSFHTSNNFGSSMSLLAPGIASSTTTNTVRVNGGVHISQTTDATSLTSGGALTIDGGLAVAKKLYVGTSEFIGGGDSLGISRLALHGVSGSAGSGPHFHAIVDNDGRPAFQNLNFAHNNICLGFDIYYDGTNFLRSASTNNGFQIYKLNDVLQFNYGSQGTVGTTVVTNTAMSINGSGNITMPNVLTVQGTLTAVSTIVTSSYIQVNGTTGSSSLTYAYYAYNGGVNTGVTTDSPPDVSIRCVGRVIATEFNATSDIRIKTDIQDLDYTDIDKLLLCKPKKYKYIDELKHGINNHYGVIAQEVKEFAPELTVKDTNYIPNIFKMAIYIDTNKLSIEHELKVGEKLKLYCSTDIVQGKEKQEEILCKVIHAEGNVYTVDTSKLTKYIFVYGTEVNDMLSIDYIQFIPLLIDGYQKQHSKIDNMQNDINELKHIIQLQQQQITTLLQKPQSYLT